jgi:hypothetical protein
MGVFVLVVVFVVLVFLSIWKGYRGAAKRQSRLRAPIVKPQTKPVAPRPMVTVVSRGYEQTEADFAFEDKVRDKCDYVIKGMFYAHVAGVTYPNADGSQRLQVIRKSRVGEVLLLVPDDSIPGHPGAVAIHRSEGGQLGYLDARLAGETLRDGIEKYVCVFRRNLYKPDTQILAGAIICMARMQENVLPQ